MKKISILLIVTLITLTSCGRSGWNCKNRYCKATEKVTSPTTHSDNVTV